eukprot:g8349.t1
MSLVDAPSSPPPPSASSPEDAGTTAGTEEKNVPISTATASKTVVAPAPNGKTPTPLPARPRVEQAASESMAPAADSGPTAPAAAEAQAETEPDAVDPAPVPVSTLGEEISASAAPATSEQVQVEAGVAASETETAEKKNGGDGEGDGMSVSDLQDALPATTTEETGAGAAPAGEGEAESAEEEASTNSLKDDPGTPEECNLFVGDLARNLTEEKLEKAFEQHGRVMSVSIKRDRATGKNLGYGFVKLSSHQEARAAKEAMQGVELGGRRVRVGWAQKNTSLYVGGLEAAGGAITTEMLQREFARFGPLDKELTAIKSGAKVGFVKYRYRLHAETAKKELHDRPAFGGLCPSIQIEWNSVESNAQDSETYQAGSETGGDDRTTSGGDSAKDAGKGRSSSHNVERASGGNFRQRAETSSNTVHVQFEGEQSRVSAVNEVMIRKCFAKWDPVVDIVIPASRFNGVSPGPRQLPRCWGFVHFPPTAEGERAAADAIKNLNGTTISELRVHCTMSRTSGAGWRKGGMGGGGGGGRSRRHSSGGGDSNRAMSHGGGGQGFGGRNARSSMDGPGAPQGRGGGWGGNPGMHRQNMQMQMQQGRHLPPGAPGGQHPPFPAHMQQMPHHLQPHLPTHQHGGSLHPHPQAPHHHQQMYAAGFHAAAAGPAFVAGQYPIPGTVPPAGPEGAAGGGGSATGGGGGGGGADMMVPTPYGMAPYPYAMSFQGVPYTPAQQGYPMGYQQIYQGYPYANPQMPQGQQQVPVGGVQTGPQQQQQSGPGTVPQTGPQSGPPAVPQSGAAKSAVNAQRQQQQQQPHMGMQQHAVMIAGQGQQNPATGSGGGGGGLNVGVPSYMPQQMYQLPQQQLPGAGGEGAAVDPSSGDKHGGVQ